MLMLRTVSSHPRRYLIFGASVIVMDHVPLQLRAVGEGVAALRAAVVVLAGLVAILDVLLQRGIALVTPGAVGASVQLGEGVGCSWKRRVTSRHHIPCGSSLTVLGLCMFVC